jgi:hypothetical protein
LKKRIRSNREKLHDSFVADQALYAAAVEEFTQKAPVFSNLIRASPQEVVCTILPIESD